VIRIAHPAGRSDAHQALIGWLEGKVSDDDARRVLLDVDDFLVAMAVTTAAEAIAVIRERRVPWEFLPSGVLKDAGVWSELTAAIGLTALVRNLARRLAACTRSRTRSRSCSPARAERVPADGQPGRTGDRGQHDRDRPGDRRPGGPWGA
jgi:hypothetical protein